jgi:aminopeptidase I
MPFEKTVNNNFGQRFIDFIDNNPTPFHVADYSAKQLTQAGYKYLPEREPWLVQRGGKYFTIRNGSSVAAFVIGTEWTPGEDGIGIIAAHIDALSLQLKPISKKDPVDGFRRVGAAPYSDALNPQWWNRDLGIAGRVIVREQGSGIKSKLVNLSYPVAQIPIIAEHFGLPPNGPYNLETQMVPVIGLEGSQGREPTDEEKRSPLVGKHDISILRAVAKNAGVRVQDLIQLELHFYDCQGGNFGGMNKEFIFAARMDDKLCSFAALHGLLNSEVPTHAINVACLYDNEEIGSQTRQGAVGGLFDDSMRRVFATFGMNDSLLAQTFANSFLVSADVGHAVNPNFTDIYLERHKPALNTGVVAKIYPHGRTTTTGSTMAFIERVAEKSDSKLQYFHIRNDSRAGGTLGPFVSTKTGIRAVDVGIPVWSMHSMRNTTGSRDVDIGVNFFAGFYNRWVEVNNEFDKEGSF